MRPRCLALLLPAALAGCAQVRPAAAPSAEERAVVAALQRVFDGMAARDTSLLHAAFAPEATLAAIDSVGGVDAIPARPWIRSVARASDRWVERMVAPRVHIDGPVATVWTFYTFHLGERFLHCGTDAAVLVRQPDGWRVQHLAFTMRTTGCTPPSTR